MCQYQGPTCKQEKNKEATLDIWSDSLVTQLQPVACPRLTCCAESKCREASVRTCVLHVCGGVGVSHGVNVHKLLLEHGQQEGQTIVQTNVEDELMGSRHRVGPNVEAFA